MRESYHDHVESQRYAMQGIGRECMAAVIDQAQLDLKEFRISKPHPHMSSKDWDIYRSNQRAYISAHLWFASERRDYMTAFAVICDQLNLPAEKIRRKLGISQGDSLFGWTNLAFEKDGK